MASANELVLHIVADARGGLATLGQVQQAARGVRTEVEGLDASFAQLSGSGLIVPRDLAKALVGAQGALGATEQGVESLGQATGQSNAALTDAVGILGELAQRQGGLVGTLGSLVSTTPTAAAGLTAVGTAGATAGTTVASTLGASLLGPVGILAALGLVVSAAPAVAEALDEAFVTAAERAEEAQDAAAELARELLSFAGEFDLSAAIQSVEEAEAAQLALAAEIANTAQEAARYIIAGGKVYDQVADTFVATTTEAGQRMIQESLALEDRLVKLDALNQLTSDRLAELQQRTEEGQAAVRDALDARREAAKEAEREAERQRRDAERAAERAAREAQQRRDKAARDAQREADRRLAEAQRREEAARRERERLEEQHVQLLAGLRIEVIEDATARELATVDRALAQRLEAIAEAETKRAVTEAQAEEARTLATEAAEQDRAAIRERAIEADLAAQRRRSDAEAALAERLARLAGATEAEILDARLVRLRAQLDATAAAVGVESDLYRELTSAIRTAEVDVLELRQRAAEAGMEAASDAVDRVLEAEVKANAERVANDKRMWEDRVRLAEDALGALLGAAVDELFRERRFREEDIEAEQADFAARDAALEESLRRRQISATEYDAEQRALAADRAQFERELAEDQRDVLGAIAGESLALARRIAEDAIAAHLAEGAAAYFSKLVGFYGFLGPLALPAAVATIPAFFALADAIIPEFAAGGYTGPGGRLDPAGIVHAGEFVLTQDATRGNVAGLYALQGLLERGMPLDQLMGFQQGGFVPSVFSSAPASRPSTSTPASAGGAGLSGLEARLGQLVDQVVRLKTAPPPVAIGDAASRQLRDAGAQASSRTSIRSIQPRRR